MAAFSAQMVAALCKDDPANLSPHQESSSQVRLGDSLQELELLRNRIEQAYDAGVYNLEKFTSKVSNLDKQADVVKAKLAENERTSLNRSEFISVASAISQDLDDPPAWVANHDPAEVNRLLHVLIDKAIVNVDGGVELDFK
jgi:hypothetical protein